jgi:hydroxyethylthiazole kinase-like uncharacterized protein yjeF
MKPILTIEEMRRVDALSPTPIHDMMHRAGYSVALEAAEMGATYGSQVDVLAGKGNNGGDGYVAAMLLQKRGASVRVHQFGEPNPDSPAGAAAIVAARAGVRIAPVAPPSGSDLVIDALFGTGFAGELASEAIEWTDAPTPVLSVDIPSGLDGDTGMADGAVFRANRTVAFHALKLGHVLGDGPEICGETSVHDIGIVGGDPAMQLMTESDVEKPRRPLHAHKWNAGAVATIGGMPGLTGAALLAARTALRAGAGVSTVLTTAATNQTYETLAAEIPTMQASETDNWLGHESEVLALLGKFQVLIIGPGLEPVPAQFVEGVLEGFEGAVVVDAGAIGALSRIDTLLERSAPTVITPHAGEFERFSGMSPTYDSAMRLAEATESVVLLKGSPTFVAGQGLTVINSGGPELSSIGTGDVLAGVIAALMAMGVDAERAAQSGAYLHGVAGARVAASQTVTAGDLVDEVGRLVRER